MLGACFPDAFSSGGALKSGRKSGASRLWESLRPSHARQNPEKIY
jgi:hypothetical protein